MDFICYLNEGWAPLIRPAEATRAWMTKTAEGFAYRCLPLNIANAHGWEILCPDDVVAYWTGGSDVADVVVRSGRTVRVPAVSLFGQGVLSFHIEALFRTPPGWDLWITGSPNRPKPGIAALSGVVETDWSPYTFTMNWKFTRRNHWVRFEKHEPICFVFPVRRGALDRMEPKFVPLAENPDLLAQFEAWSRSRSAFQATMTDGQPRPPTDKWQKRYFRGLTMNGEEAAPDHRTKLRLKPFAAGRPGGAQEAVEIDETRMAGLLVATARALHGEPDATALGQALEGAGVPPAQSARIAAATIAAIGKAV